MDLESSHPPIDLGILKICLHYVEISSICSLFDSILERYKVYKVETIGDAYMVSSGVPDRNDEGHAREIALLSLDVQKSISHFKVPSQSGGIEPVRIRIGLHSGQ